MNFSKSDIPGLYIIDIARFKDERGWFIKAFNFDDYAEESIHFEIKEVFYNISQKDVIRGMHFQIPPFDHDKVVTV